MGNYVNGALFRGRIFCRLHLNARLKFPALCSAQCHMPKQTTCAVSDFRLQRLLSYCIMTADHSQPLQQQTQHKKKKKKSNTENYRHGFLPITDCSANQLSVPINRQNRWIGRPLIVMNIVHTFSKYYHYLTNELWTLKCFPEDWCVYRNLSSHIKECQIIWNVKTETLFHIRSTKKKAYYNYWMAGVLQNNV